MCQIEHVASNISVSRLTLGLGTCGPTEMGPQGATNKYGYAFHGTLYLGQPDTLTLQMCSVDLEKAKDSAFDNEP